MRIGIVAVGRMKLGPERELVSRYLDRAIGTGKKLGLTGFEIAELSESRAASATSRKAEEAKAIAVAMPAGAAIVALDERGKSLSSEAFADQIAHWRDAGKSALSLVIGGADGLDPDLISSASLTLSFSPLTWPHQLVRIMLAEQLYRVTTILSGHPYHRA
ncbi:MAG: 23S rRNA (pseudouridine(1915)-N(3))-methyltransferase RlmH [Devosia sp.]